MKINEVIAEGIGDWLANKAGQRVQKIQQDPALAAKHGLTYIDPTIAQPSTNPMQSVNPPEGGVFLVKASNGNQYFKSYKGTWHNKGTVPDELSVGGTKITNPTEISALEALLPASQLVGVKPDPKDNTGQAYLIDRRKTAILNFLLNAKLLA